MKKILSSSASAFLKNPQIVFLFVFQYLIIRLYMLNSLIKFDSPITEIAFLILHLFVFLVISSLFISLFIGASDLALKNQFTIKKSFSYLKFTSGNFVLLIILTLFSAAGFGLANLAGLIAKKYFGGNIPFYSAVSVFILFTFLLVFLSFQFFFYTLKNQKIFMAIKSSIALSKRIYWSLIFLLLLVFIIDGLLSIIPIQIISDIINFLFVYPLTALILTSMFRKYS